MGNFQWNTSVKNLIIESLFILYSLNLLRAIFLTNKAERENNSHSI